MSKDMETAKIEARIKAAEAELSSLRLLLTGQSMSDLKQKLDAVLGSTIAAMAAGIELPVLVIPKIDELRGRLALATVTEPGQADLNNDVLRSRLLRFLDEARQHAGPARLAEEAHDLLRAIKPEPTDAELLAQLRTLLPKGWVVEEMVRRECKVSTSSKSFGDCLAYPQYAALRKPGGPERVAQALKVLAGEEAE